MPASSLAGCLMVLATLALAACGGSEETAGSSDTGSGGSIAFETVQPIALDYVNDTSNLSEPCETEIVWQPEDIAEAVRGLELECDESEPADTEACPLCVAYVAFIELEDAAAVEAALAETDLGPALVSGDTIVRANGGYGALTDPAEFVRHLHEECGCGEIVVGEEDSG